jgi:hypothetical protein
MLGDVSHKGSHTPCKQQQQQQKQQHCKGHIDSSKHKEPIC